MFVQFPVFLKDGSIMTDKQEYIQRIPAGQAIKGKVLYRDKSRDLALVQLEKIPAGTKALPLATKSVGVGATVWNIGNPGPCDRCSGSPRGGCGRSALRSSWSAAADGNVFEIRAKMVTTTNPTNPGDSGGPLFDKRGYQVAVTQSGTRVALMTGQYGFHNGFLGMSDKSWVPCARLAAVPDRQPPHPCQAAQVGRLCDRPRGQVAALGRAPHAHPRRGLRRLPDVGLRR